MTMDRHMRSHMSGKLGEVRAEQFLQERGMRILARNEVCAGAEIDLIALDARVIAFIEVKTRSGSRSGMGREAVTSAKQRRICRGALMYMTKNGLTDRQARFDVLEIQDGRVTYIENAFPYCGPAF